MPCRTAGNLVQHSLRDIAEHAADERRGEEGQQVVRQPVLRRPTSAGERVWITLDVRLTLHEREDLAVGH